MFAAILEAIRCFFIVCAVTVPGATEETIDPCLLVPDRACEYVSLIQEAPNPSRHAAQIDQESNFRPFAKSPYAYGIAQFTPATAKWMAGSLCKHLGPWQKYDPEWGIRCSIIYMEYLKNEKHRPYCKQRYVAEQRYNGGQWVEWEMRDSDGSLQGAERICGNARLSNGRRRALASCKENYEYPRRISKRQVEFQSLGGTSC